MSETTEFHTVARIGDIREGEARAFVVDGKLIALFCQNGQYCAIDDVCPHMGGSLSEGLVEAGIVTCPWHGWRFRIADGTWADNPRIKTGSYAVRVVGEEIQVGINQK
jgi:nitrite reductase (NADH) small subunit/3-phenylpropionate/trans-cinnamate dioxygenase ferredoxin subunit